MLQQVHNMQSHGNTFKLQMDVLAVKKRPTQIFKRNVWHGWLIRNFVLIFFDDLLFFNLEYLKVMLTDFVKSNCYY